MNEQVSVELRYHGDGTVKLVGGVYTGAVADPRTSGGTFVVRRTAIDDQGLWKPVSGESGYDGALQIDVTGDSTFYEELGRYFLALSKLDTRLAPGFREPFYDLMSRDKRTKLDIVFRKKQTRKRGSKQ